mgnify:FL=1
MNGKPEGRTPSVMMVIEGMFPAIGGGGAESQLRTLATNLSARGVRVRVCAPYFRNYPLTAQTEVDGIAVHRLSYPFVRLWGAVVLQSKLAWHIWRMRGEIDAIHSHIATNMSAVCCVMGRLLGIPVLVKLTGMTEMVGGILDPKAGFGTRMRRWAMKRATRIQAISQRIVLQLLAVGFDPKQVMYLPNAVDLRRFEGGGRSDVPVPEALAQKLAGVEKRSFVALFAGRLIAEKDVDLLVRGWAASLRGRDDVMLLLAGRGKLGPELTALAESLGVGNSVRVLGPVEHMEHVLPLAHVGILTSRAEGLSNSLLEYMASGLPVLGSRVSGNEDFISPGQTGWLFEPGDEQGLTEALRDAAQLSAEALRQVGRNARQRVAAQASLPAVLDRLCEFYETGTGNTVAAQRRSGAAGAAGEPSR